jgi:hypothetical protein
MTALYQQTLSGKVHSFFMLLIFIHVKEQNVHQKKALADVWSHEQAT